MLRNLFIYILVLASLTIGGLGGCGKSGMSGQGSAASPAGVLVSIEVTPTNPSIANGTTVQFTATGIYSNNTTQDLTASVTWSSSDTSFAKFMSTGRAQGMGTGKTTITAKQGNISGSTTLTVTQATLVSIAVTPVNTSIAKGTTEQFQATGTFSDGTTQSLTTSVTWSSSSPSVVAVSNAADSMGLATAAATGSTTVSAASGAISGSTTLTVTAATLASIDVTPTNPSIALGTTQQFAATGTYSDGSTQNLTAVATWNSSAPSVAAVSNAAGSNGLATSVASGSTTVSAASGGISGSTTLTVTTATLSSIAVTPANPSIPNGSTQQFSATGTFSDGSTQDITTSATWSTSNTNVATISNAAGSNGLATATGAGQCSISALSSGITGTTTLTVQALIPVTLSWNAPTEYTDGISLDPLTDIASYTLYYGVVSGMYTKTVNVPNPGSTPVSQTLNLPSGTYYFVVTATDTIGVESAYSTETSRSF